MSTGDELAQLLSGILGEEGWRERRLRLHAMAHTVINDAGYTGTTGGTLPEAAYDLVAEMGEAVDRIQGWIRRIEPLERLAPQDDSESA